ncbi:class I SAM-dependent methyltransferase [Symmachiella dynata]|uniref:Spermidine synthase n=1 Tax=Symmachiella dynata TaxID=2527995 RepID=A0A517ZWB2_9PLAN|nr:methyltransferase domain-containing protein [Symmachiella dynata]QDT51050.1 Spermidine synthase [Symmachiella dynata]QDU46730.1 Spermidine synthase [Symmachiella dynata]|tara:strand:- start:187 stop:861 length:675 start_codon:yes stop_codon:yes gene_type:complete
MKRMFKEYREFFREFRSRFETTGAVAPSGRFLAGALSGPLKKHDGPVRVLEVGPGTGAVTRQIVKHLKPGDRFDLVELNENFVESLNRLFSEEDLFRAVAEFSEVHLCPLQEFEASEPFDFIISGLPLNNFPAALVEEIFESYWRLLAPGGTLSYFEYMYVRPVRRLVSKSDEKQRLTDLDKILGTHLENHRIARDWVFVNAPPAWVQHLRRQESVAAADSTAG